MEQRLKSAMDIGEEMLISGAEIHRVEDSMCRILKSLGALRVDVFIITSSMIVSVTTSDGSVITQTRRIHSSGTDFDKLHRLNALSRAICEGRVTPEEIDGELIKIKPSRVYPVWVEILCYAIIAGSFTMFFGGDVPQSLVAVVIGIATWGVVWLSERTVKNKIFSRFVASFIATALAYLSVTVGLTAGPDEIIIGNIMVLIPGIGLTNSLRDIFTGDSITGILRCLEALLVALAIAAGFFVFAALSGGAV